MEVSFGFLAIMLQRAAVLGFDRNGMTEHCAVADAR
jgi:hypothetical protein